MTRYWKFVNRMLIWKCTRLLRSVNVTLTPCLVKYPVLNWTKTVWAITLRSPIQAHDVTECNIVTSDGISRVLCVMHGVECVYVLLSNTKSKRIVIPYTIFVNYSYTHNAIHYLTHTVFCLHRIRQQSYYAHSQLTPFSSNLVWDI